MNNAKPNVSTIVVRNISQLIGERNEGSRRGALARLRRAITSKPGSDSLVWDYTLADVDEELLGQGVEPSASEWAIHTAMTLFALHQQGKDPDSHPMHVSGQSLGTAVSKLTLANGERDSAIKSRFDQVVTADTMSELTHHLRGMIQLLKRDSIGLDYGMLARDISQFYYADRRDSVRLAWGRSYYSGLYRSGSDSVKQEDTAVTADQKTE